MSPRALIAGLLATCLLAGCGGSSSSTPTSTSTSTARSSSSQGTASRQLTLHETEFKITPASPRVPSTGTITITVKNVGAVFHALAIQTPSGVRRTGDIAPGATASLKVDLRKAGHYLMYCPIDSHRQLGMRGALVVGSGSSSGY